MLRLRRDRRGPFAGLDLELPPHTHTGPLPQRLYSARYDVLSYSDDRHFFINGAAFIDTDGHIGIQRNGGRTFLKVLIFAQKKTALSQRVCSSDQSPRPWRQNQTDAQTQEGTLLRLR